MEKAADFRPRTRRIKVLMLSWEYPPVLVGGLGRHVHALATRLARAGHDVTVATRHAPGAALDEVVDGVRVVRAPEDPPRIPLDTAHLLAWTMAFNHTLTRAALRATAGEDFDLVHAHDWLVTHAAITMRHHLNVPMVATVHATEVGRHQGWLSGDLSRSIHSVEWWLGREAARVLVCSEYMRSEVTTLFGLSADQVSVIPNGVDLPQWRATPADVRSARARFAGDGPLIGFAGRLVHEKGVQLLLNALPRLRRQYGDVRVVIAGDGPHRAELESVAHRLGVAGSVTFAGFLGPALPSTMACTDAMVVPSLYEPFGLVALEAAAAGAPLAVSATGGLAEIVRPGVTGVTFRTGDDAALAEAVGTQLGDRGGALRMARAAGLMVRRRFGWDTVAERTADAYVRVLSESAVVPLPQSESPPAPVPIGDGNLLAAAGLLV
jgi:glycogen(starch) synthase